MDDETRRREALHWHGEMDRLQGELGYNERPVRGGVAQVKIEVQARAPGASLGRNGEGG